jgi:hypothetical protein
MKKTNALSEKVIVLEVKSSDLVKCKYYRLSCRNNTASSLQCPAYLADSNISSNTVHFLVRSNCSVHNDVRIKLDLAFRCFINEWYFL